jgi:Ca-activated chloride channel family protein
MSDRSKHRLVAAIGALLCAWPVAARSVAAEQPAASELIVIFDASGSMWGKVDKEAKITIARRVMKDVLAQVPPGVAVGLVAYGHRSKTDCADIETIVAPGSRDRAALEKAVESIQPKGMTPITASLQKVIELVRQREGASTVVLVSDGIETCGGDACKVVREARSAGVHFILHVVGFDLAKADVSQLECAAQAGGGLYLTAASAAELGAALNQAVALTPDTPAGKLSVKATADGKLADVLLTVTRAGGERVSEARTYTSGDSNPRIFALPDGTYDVTARAVSIKGAPEQRLAGIEIRDGATIEKSVDFGTGTLSVKVTRNGALSDATIQVYRAGTRESAAAGRTYRQAETNPKTLRLQAGTYDVEIASVEVTGKPTKRWESVEVEGSTPTELAHDFAGGVLRVGAVAAGKLVDAVVSISASGESKVVAQGRTYTAAKTNPKSFELAPGNYTVTVKPVKPAGAKPLSFEVSLSGGATVEKNAEFAD